MVDAGEKNFGVCELNFDVNRWWSRLVIALVIIRVIMVGLLLGDVPKLDYHVGWAFYHGGDIYPYFIAAQRALGGEFTYVPMSGAWVLWLALAIRLTNANVYEEALAFLTPFHSFVLGSLSVWVMAQLTWRLTASRWQSLIATVAWTFSPYLMWWAFGFFPQAVSLRNVFVSRQFWANGLTDGQAIFFALLGGCLLVCAYPLTSAQGSRQHLWILAGVSLGLAAAIRIHSLAMIAPMVFALMLMRQWRAMAWLALGGVVGFSPQLIYSALFGRVLDIPYIRNWLRPEENGLRFEWNNTPFSPRFLLENFLTITRGNWALMLIAVLGCAILAYAFWQMWVRRGKVEALTAFVAPAASFGVHVSTYLFFDDPIRFTMPALSLGVPALVWTFFQAGLLFRNFWVKGSRV